MEDNNIIKIKKYIPGYDSETRQQIEPGYIRTQTVVDRDTEDFKYGLEYWEGSNSDKNRYINPLYLFQDPLFPIFDIVIDSKYSPLLSDGVNSLYNFLQDYGDIFSIGTRKKIYEEFKKTLFILFNKDFKDVDIKNKSYYINSINGLDKLTARIVEFEKDKISININEDVSMIAAYLSHLYNNLSYSYRDQRQMIPANLLRFNMFIKIHDVRNMPFYTLEKNETVTSFDKSYQIYLLRDCTFEFKKSKNFDDNIIVGGFDAGLINKASSISIDVSYKSIEIESEYPLIRESFYLNYDNNKSLRLNNKYGSIYLNDRDLSLNSNYITQSKSVDKFYDELNNNNDLNNNSSLTQEGFDYQGADKRAKNNYKFGKVSSNKNNDTRKSSTGEIDKKHENKMYDDFYKDRAFNLNDTVGENGHIYNSDVINESGLDPKWKTPNQSDTTFEIQNEYRTTKIDPINSGRPYDPSVSDKQWNFQSDYPSPQTGPSLSIWRDSILNQINLGSFLMTLPFNIAQMFLNGYHGMQTDYIDGSGPDIIYGHRGDDNLTEEYLLPVLNGEVIPNSIINAGGVYNHSNDLNGEIISTEKLEKNKLKGEIIPINETNQEKLDGDMIPIEIPSLETLDGEYIISKIKPEVSLDGEKISFKIKQKDYLDGEYIISKMRPPISLNGEFIPFNIVNQIPLSGSINTSFNPRGPLSGVIDTSFHNQPELEGYIDTSFKIQPQIEGTIDTTFSLKTFENIYLYNNNYEQREVDLGLLYINVNKENILPIIYLYTKIDKYNHLSNYYIYNKTNNEIKTPKNLNINSEIKNILPFSLIYKYDNNIDIKKSLNNIKTYNNDINHYNNMLFLNLINEIPVKDKISRIELYDNTISNKTLDKIYLYDKKYNDNLLVENYLYNNEDLKIKSLNKDYILNSSIKLKEILNIGNIYENKFEEKKKIEVGSLYEPISIKKLIEPIKLFELTERKKIDLGIIYENTNEKNNKLSIEINDINTSNKKDIDKIYIDKDFIDKDDMSEMYLNDKKDKDTEKLNESIHLDNNYKKEKQKLNNERLR